VRRAIKIPGIHYEYRGFSNFLAQNGVGKNGVGVSSRVSCQNPKKEKSRKSNFLESLSLFKGAICCISKVRSFLESAFE
jgi:hypothetical protein